MAISIILFLIAVPLVLFYSTGYRIGPDLHLYKTGGLYVSSPVSGSKIFINNRLERETNIFQSGIFLQSLMPKKYSILIAKDGYWPWQKNLYIKEQFVTEARAMLVPKDPQGKVILKENYSPLEFSKYEEILLSLKELKKLSITATTTRERFTNHNRERLWWNPNENQLWVDWLSVKNSVPYFFCDDNFCDEKILVLNSKFPIRNAEFYPKRKDIVIAAVQNGVYAIEMDSRGGRLLQPIYKGREPIFTIYKNENAIYVLDDNNLMEIKLE